MEIKSNKSQNKMLKFLRKNPFIILILVLYFYSFDFKKKFNRVKFEAENNNRINLKIYTNWFELEDLGHNAIKIARKWEPNRPGIIIRTYYSGKHRNERIDNVINVEWLKNDSLVVIKTILKNKQVKTDSLFWLEK